jgi:hypothetical protein
VDDTQRFAGIVDEAVRRMQSRAGVGDDARGNPIVERAGLAGRSATKNMKKRVPLDPFEDEVADPVLLPDLEDVADVRMIGMGRDPRLVEQHVLEVGLMCQVRKQRLDREELREAAVSRQARSPYARHAPRADGNE